jgi:Flp pilus assembly pilin Flp
MPTIKKLMARVCSDVRGVTALEYGVIAAGTVLAITAIMPNIATALSSIFTTIQGAL